MTDLNLTVLLQGRAPEDQLGYDCAFRELHEAGGLTGYHAFPYRGVDGRQEWERLFSQVLDHMRQGGSNGLLLQYFHGRGLPDPRRFLENVRRLPQRPVIAASCGDGFGPFLSPPPKSLLAAAAGADLTFCTSMGRLARILARSGAPRITLMPHSACHRRFGGEWHAPAEPELDVVFIGSRPRARNPRKQHFWAAWRRTRYVEVLERRYGRKFGLFGHGWNGIKAWQGPVPFEAQVAVSQRGRVLFGGYPGSWCEYYASDRPFIGILSGVPMVDLAVPRVSSLLKPGEEWVLATDPADVVRCIDRLLEDGDLRRRIGIQGATAVRLRHLSTHRSRSIARIMSQVGDALRSGRTPAPPVLDFFHDGVDAQAEATTALLRW